jgi:carbamoylphosphate synthase large subunit
MAKLNKRTCSIKSRHPSHNVLRKKIVTEYKSVFRLGSTTEVLDDRIEINKINAVKNSANKLLMKKCFTEAGVKTADWWVGYLGNGETHFTNKYSDKETNYKYGNLPYPIVAKHIYGSRGTGNTLLHTQQELETWLNGKTLNRYIFEKYYNYNREYRLHVTEEGCFYTCRKMIKNDTPDDKRWFKNSVNSTWIVEENPLFDKPSNWDDIINESVKALQSVGLDIGALDVRVQSKHNNKDKVREYPEFIIIEINSAPSFGEITAEKYLEEIPKLIKKKHLLK